MAASYKYSWTMPKHKFKVVQKECLDLFNRLANRGEELTKEDYTEIKTFQDENQRLPIRHTILELKSVLFIKNFYNNTTDEIKSALTGDEWFLQKNPFKI